MEFIKRAWKWIIKHSVAIIIGLCVFLYAWVNVQVQKNETKQKEAEFKCQTLCFPQQHEYLFAGELGSCWCYTDGETLRKYTD